MTTLVERLLSLRERGLPDDVRLIGPEAAAEITRLQAELDAKGKREVKVRWNGHKAFIGEFEVGFICLDRGWQAFSHNKRIGIFNTEALASAAVEKAALDSLIGNIK